MKTLSLTLFHHFKILISAVINKPDLEQAGLSAEGRLQFYFPHREY